VYPRPKWIIPAKGDGIPQNKGLISIPLEIKEGEDTPDRNKGMIY